MKLYLNKEDSLDAKVERLEAENAALREMLRVCANNANDSGEEDSMEDQINELLGKEAQL